MESEAHGEAGGVDGVAGVGLGVDEVVRVRVGEEVVAPAAGGRAPCVDDEGEAQRHLRRRHLRSGSGSGWWSTYVGCTLSYIYGQSAAFGRKEGRACNFSLWMDEIRLYTFVSLY